MALNVFNDDNGVVDHQSDRQDDGKQGEQIERETEQLHQEERPNERDRNGNNRHNHRPKRSEEQKDHHHHDEQRIDQSFYHFVDGVVDVGRRIVSHLRRHSGWQFFLD